jgi:PAS domain S-box-containing protein
LEPALELNHTSDRFRLLFEATLDYAVFHLGFDGLIETWNPGAERIFGHTSGAAVGQSLDLIIPEQLRARHWEGYRRVMASGATRYGRELLKVPALRRDGTRISLEFTVVPVRGASGEILGVGAIIREVTERWRQERALRERLAALEAKERATGGRLAAGEDR